MSTVQSGIESMARIKRQKGYLQKALLSAIAVPGILLVAMAAPNTVQLLGGFSRKRMRRFPEETRSALSRLAKNGCIQFEDFRGKKYARITTKGKMVLVREAARIRSQTKKKWDGRYRLVMFDIKEERKSLRSKLRYEMKQWGFLRLQDSVWLYPHDCEYVITLLKTELRLGKEVIYAIVEEMENDGPIRAHFGLKKR